MTGSPTGDERSMADDLLAIDRDLADAERRIDTVAANHQTAADRIEIRNVQRHVRSARVSLDARLAPDPAVRNLALLWRRAQIGRSRLGTRKGSDETTPGAGPPA
jgi:hypothetical protein